MTVGEIIEKCMPPRCVRWRYSSHESLRLCVCVDCHDFASRVDYVKCLSTSYSRVRGFLERRRITAVAHLCRFPTSSISLCGKRVARRAAILSSDSALFSASRCVGVHVFFISSICGTITWYKKDAKRKHALQRADAKRSGDGDGKKGAAS